MTDLVSAAITFPAVLFGAALVVAVCFWLLVLAGAAGHDSFDTDLDAEAVGFAGVPVAVSVSLFVVISWFTGLAGSVLVLRGGTTGTPRAALHLAVLAGALLIAWGAVRLLVRFFRRCFPAEPPSSRQHFVGRVCTIRTVSAGSGFGQAEVAAADGSTAIVRVRRPVGRSAPAAVFTSGSTGLLHSYDAEGGFFWVLPHDAAFTPRPLPRRAA
ncbi:hypothetical protein OG206_17260 [Streptomyces sp. NBC_01341]|uniref:hypothetical protein n=1 Tax=Streptomyces sp. NBC_01341 TaxID=2903831 RepID=UPI002E0EE691|nr:hypothetical protein OG206_17260 [Streptomyces sp. NBC_01341]